MKKEDSYLGGQENFAKSPPSSIVYNMGVMVTSKSTSSSSIKKSGRSRRGKQKRVVQIPMKETEGSMSNTPPSDSWAWRKYGQKPIKGSPYPRGYYRCSSNKGCPARKQVEKSRMDPTMVVVTYSSEHNHALPVFKNHHHHKHNHSNNSSSVAAEPEPEPNRVIVEPVEPEDKLVEELRWLGEMEIIATTSSTILEGPIFGGYDDDVASVFMPMREEDELLFADLDELPEFSPVFKHGGGVAAVLWDYNLRFKDSLLYSTPNNNEWLIF